MEDGKIDIRHQYAMSNANYLQKAHQIWTRSGLGLRHQYACMVKQCLKNPLPSSFQCQN